MTNLAHASFFERILNLTDFFTLFELVFKGHFLPLRCKFFSFLIMYMHIIVQLRLFVTNISHSRKYFFEKDNILVRNSNCVKKKICASIGCLNICSFLLQKNKVKNVNCRFESFKKVILCSS